MYVPPIPCLVEGTLDEVVVRKLLDTSALEPAAFYLESPLLMSEYARERWNPLRAAERSPSLQRTILQRTMTCFRNLADGGRW